MKVVIQKDSCLGHGQCELVAPQVFEVREDGLAHLRTLPVERLRADIARAVAACPEHAISLAE